VAKLNDKPLLALTMRLPWNGFQNAAPHAFDLIGGKGLNRTLDPGIMSALPRPPWLDRDPLVDLKSLIILTH
jgi:hypothetical protein